MMLITLEAANFASKKALKRQRSSFIPFVLQFMRNQFCSSLMVFRKTEFKRLACATFAVSRFPITIEPYKCCSGSPVIGK